MTVADIDSSSLMSATVINYDQGMARWAPGAQGRLEHAAIELFSEQGFEATTVAQIADRAGLTERTFFRHYADKREVLFAGGDEFQRVFVEAVTAAPAESAPLAAVVQGALAVGELLDTLRGREFAGWRHRIIAANPELQERELMKLASVAAGLDEALRVRGVSEPTASLTAEFGLAVFKVAFERWLDESVGGQRPLVDHIDEALSAAPLA